MNRTPLRRISAKREARMRAANGGRLPFSTIGPRKGKKRKYARPLKRRPFPGALDPRSYITQGGRVRLFGEDYFQLRWAAYLRAKGMCQCGCSRRSFYDILSFGHPDAGELSHNEHGARKSDELSRVKWMRHECHMKSHNCGGRPLARKPERVA